MGDQVTSEQGARQGKEVSTTNNVVVAVEWGTLSKDAFIWYLTNLHTKKNFVHVCHVPDFRGHIHSKMAPMDVLEVMIQANGVADQLKQMYDTILKERKIQGKFVRVGGNNRRSAIIEYCKLVDARLLVIGTEPKFKPEPDPVPSDDTPRSSDASRASTGRSLLQTLEDMGPFVATVSHDLLQDADVPVTVVYRPTLCGENGRKRQILPATKRP